MNPQKEFALENDAAFLQTVSDISGLSVAFWSNTFFWNSESENPNPCNSDSKLRMILQGGCESGDSCIFFEDEYVFWGLMNIGNYYIALGPVQGNTPKEEYKKQYVLKHNLPENYPIHKKISFGEMTNYLSLLSCHYFCVPIKHDEIVIKGVGEEHLKWEAEGDLEQYQLLQSEYDRGHEIGIDYEKEMTDAVRNGDVEKVKKLMSGSTPDIGEVGKVAEEDRKQMEYMGVSLLTLLTRAAVEGGVLSETAHELGDVYLRRLAVAFTKGSSFMTLLLRAMIEFAEAVNKVKTEKSKISHIEACKAYVEKNLRKDIKVCDIAPAIGISRTYLAHLFKRVEGISLQQYIQREKCRHAARMLKYSDYPISLISEYFGFSSQSYFGVCFEHWYGSTPSKYRNSSSST